MFNEGVLVRPFHIQHAIAPLTSNMDVLCDIVLMGVLFDAHCLEI